MYRGRSVGLILPARNEAQALPTVLAGIPGTVDRVLVVDNGSTDDTARVARARGAQVVTEPRAGYGRACLAGLAAFQDAPPDLILFADADGSDDLALLDRLLELLAREETDMVLAARTPAQPAALTWQQRWGNALATTLIRRFWHHPFQDLGPMRGLTWEALQTLHMEDLDYGWTVEMQIRALKAGLCIREFSVPYRKRIAGRSKISRTLKGTAKASFKILWVIGREALCAGPATQPRAPGRS